MFRFWAAGTALARVVGPEWWGAAGSCLPDPAIPLHALSSVTQVREQIGSSNFFLHNFGVSLQNAVPHSSKEIEFSDDKRLNERLT